MKRFLCLFLVLLMLLFSFLSCKEKLIELHVSDYLSIYLDIDNQNFFKMEFGEAIEGTMLIYKKEILFDTIPATLYCSGGPQFANSTSRFVNKEGKAFTAQTPRGYYVEYCFRYNFEEKIWEPLYPLSND